MSAKSESRPPAAALDELLARLNGGKSMVADADKRPLLSREERVARFDAIRSSFKNVAEDTTPLIRRDRDDR